MAKGQTRRPHPFFSSLLDPLGAVMCRRLGRVSVNDPGLGPVYTIRMARLLFVTGTPPDVRGGSGTFVGISVLRRALAVQGHDVDLLAPAPGRPLSLAGRLLFNLRARAAVGRMPPAEAVIGFDLDGLFLRRGGAFRVASLKGVLADEARYERGAARAPLDRGRLREDPRPPRGTSPRDERSFGVASRRGLRSGRRPRRRRSGSDRARAVDGRAPVGAGAPARGAVPPLRGAPVPAQGRGDAARGDGPPRARRRPSRRRRRPRAPPPPEDRAPTAAREPCRVPRTRPLRASCGRVSPSGRVLPALAAGGIRDRVPRGDGGGDSDRGRARSGGRGAPGQWPIRSPRDARRRARPRGASRQARGRSGGAAASRRRGPPARPALRRSARRPGVSRRDQPLQYAPRRTAAPARLKRVPSKLRNHPDWGRAARLPRSTRGKASHSHKLAPGRVHPWLQCKTEWRTE